MKRNLDTSHYPQLCTKCGIVHRPAVKHCPYCGMGHIFHNRCAQKHKKATK